MEERAPHHDVEIPEPFREIDDACWRLVSRLHDELSNCDEVVTCHTPERIETHLYSDTSGGWQVDFECDIWNSFSMGYLPTRFRDYAEEQQMSALGYWVENAELPPGMAEDYEAIRNPPNLRSLYEYAADKLGKDKHQVDLDIEADAWNWLLNLPDELKQDFHETETEWLRGSYFYGLEISYLRTTDRASRFDEPVIEIAATFRASELRDEETIARLAALPSAVDAALQEMIAAWAVARFWEV
ncbi:MAG: hypothetical protein J0I99_00610 [Devosia sp.]|uniref:hypothetical protein n=1 Tax=Devosia sp. TaxID=1871048 RepID=UPI001AC93A34|nr:hypothetical protein [Devosia sp.]MBN9314218.1 hypothetical protein [Devosia sp.]